MNRLAKHTGKTYAVIDTANAVTVAHLWFSDYANLVAQLLNATYSTACYKVITQETNVTKEECACQSGNCGEKQT